jgi:4,5-dihydroxyphthalate decarboxylase
LSTTPFKIVSRTQGNNAALKNGSIEPAGFHLEFEEVPVLVQAFRRMVRGLEFDICEMALTTYLCAREHGVRFTALPIFLVRAFHHGAITYNATNGPLNPSDLEGRRVGVHRGYTVTTGVWARAVLQDEYGVDLSKITWVLSGDEHVEAYEAPSNVVPIESGETIEAMLIRNELAAAINIQSTHPALQPLIPNALDTGISALKERGHYPINHLVVVRDDILANNPGIGAALFTAFTEAKKRYLDDLREGRIQNLSDTDQFHLRMMETIDDPLPYGLAPNRQVLNELIAHAATQHILQQPVELESLFERQTLELTG